MKQRKYENLVYGFTPEYISGQSDDPEKQIVASPQAYFRGACQIPGSQYNVGFQILLKPFFLDRVPHVHEQDEYLIFLGGSFPNVFDFDAYIEFTLGKDEDAELYVIDKPTIIRVPAGVYHCPLNFIRIDKPVFFQAALMQGMFGGLYDMPDGPTEMWYNGPIDCKHFPGKKCDACKACLSMDWKKE